MYHGNCKHGTIAAIFDGSANDLSQHKLKSSTVCIDCFRLQFVENDKLLLFKKWGIVLQNFTQAVIQIESMGKKNPITGNVTMTADECRTLKDYAVSSFAEKSEKLKYKQKFEQADKNAKIWKDRFEKLNKDYEELKQKAQPFLDAIEIASEKVWAFINAILARGKELYEHKHPARNRGQDMEI